MKPFLLSHVHSDKRINVTFHSNHQFNFNIDYGSPNQEEQQLMHSKVLINAGAERSEGCCKCRYSQSLVKVLKYRMMHFLLAKVFSFLHSTHGECYQAQSN